MIVVVDDDVRFAEEIRDFLVASGYRSVLVVTHPHASGLLLLRRARLLVLDLSLATTTALKILESLQEAGSMPSVLIVSGSGDQALRDVEAAAASRGFTVLGALPKPVASQDLLRLLGSADLADDSAVEDTAAVSSNRHSQIVDCASLRCHGFHLDAGHRDNAKSTLHRACVALKVLESSSADCFIVVSMVGELVASTDIRAEICEQRTTPLVDRAKIVFDLGRELFECSQSLLVAVSDLHRGGFGVLARADKAILRDPGLVDNLPITMLAVPARSCHLLPDKLSCSAKALQYFRHRFIPTVCTNVFSREELDMARSAGFTYATGHYFN